MTNAIAPTPTAARPTSQSDDSYEDVVEMFLELRRMPAESHEYCRQRERIVARCLPLADHVASHFARRGEGLDDLVQVARLGLMNAVNRFDPAKGPSFIGFAVPTMMGEVRRYFRDYSWGCGCRGGCASCTCRSAGRPPTLPSSSAGRRTPASCRRCSRFRGKRSSNAWSPATPIASTRWMRRRGADSSGTPRSVADSVGDIDPQIEHITNREALRVLVATLPHREREVLRMRFFESMTQSQIAERIGVSQMQVSRILANTLRCLRDQLE